MRIKEATWKRNFLLDNQLGLKLIHHRLHATFETQELRVENEDLPFQVIWWRNLEDWEEKF